MGTEGLRQRRFRWQGPLHKALTAVTTTAVVATMVLAGSAGPASAGVTSGSEKHRAQAVRVTGDASGVLHFSTTRLREGTISFRISTSNSNGNAVTLFQLHRGVTLAEFAADVQEEFSQDPATAAKGTRDLVRDASFFGLADVQPGTPATATVNLEEGTYYAFDVNTGPPTASSVVRLRVLDDRDEDRRRAERDGGFDFGRADHLARVSLTSTDRFVVRGHLPARGSVLVRNVADTIHFMALQPVKAGTTDQQIQAYFDSGSQDPPPFALPGPGVAMDVLSPGQQLILSYSLPKGTYVLLCFVADDVTGMPHALMGMHKVVTLS